MDGNMVGLIADGIKIFPFAEPQPFEQGAEVRNACEGVKKFKN